MSKRDDGLDHLLALSKSLQDMPAITPEMVKMMPRDVLEVSAVKFDELLMKLVPVVDRQMILCSAMLGQLEQVKAIAKDPGTPSIIAAKLLEILKGDDDTRDRLVQALEEMDDGTTRSDQG